jgi:acyl-CoA hydrolase
MEFIMLDHQEQRMRLPSLRKKITSAASAAEWIKDGMTVGMSGFTRAGDAKEADITATSIRPMGWAPTW